MATSLQKGINAAKAGHMDDALKHLKDAIIDEPQNADVWVWIAAIIDDLDKQEIFLEKALDIDPGNVPAQRGLAYLHKRKRDQVVEAGDHLSDHTQPISPFPASGKSKKAEQFSGWTKISPEEIIKLEKAEKHNSKNGPGSEDDVKNENELTPFEIGLLGVVVVVFAIIGLLAASAIFEFELPLSFLQDNRPSLSSEPPYPGIFLYENEAFLDIKENEGLPRSEEGIPTSTQSQPIVAIWSETLNAQALNLIYQDGDYVPFDYYSGKGESDLLIPVSDLSNGLYCLQYQPGSQFSDAYYWCFKVAASGETE
jgi:tetratricopeptide (TPR) repeat protein